MQWCDFSHELLEEKSKQNYQNCCASQLVAYRIELTARFEYFAKNALFHRI
jgi:hypothetical protein